MAQKKHGHPAAAILREIAEVAEWHPRPWEEFEWLYEHGQQWVPFSSFDFALDKATGRPYAIRRKPRTKRIGNYDVPLPERKVPEVGTEYWVADVREQGFAFWTRWHGCEEDWRWLHRDLIHLDQKSAETHGRALASLMPAENDELMPREDEE